jgi:polyphenol oxidase
VHGREVRALDAATADGQVGDACITSQRGIACTIMVADCLPVLLTNTNGSVVAAAHAGWRGLAGVGEMAGKGVLESVYESFRALAQVNRAPAAMKIIAWLGPCIGPTAFEVGEDVKAAFEMTQLQASRFFVPAARGKYRADLAGLARHRLQALGVADIYGNDSSPDWCTASNPPRFFSHRRDTAAVAGNGFGTTGRMAAAIWRI